MRTLVLAALVACLLAAVLIAQGPLTPILNLAGRTDSTGALMLTAAAYSGIQTNLTPIGQLRGRTDSSGRLLTTIAGGTSTPDNLTLAATGTLSWSTRLTVTSPSDGNLLLRNAAGTDFTLLQIGGTTSSFPALGHTGAVLQAKLADNSTFAGFGAIDYRLGSTLWVTSTNPTVTSAGTSPSVVTPNGTATFRVNVGTGGTATTIVMGMPAATAGWNCQGSNLTAAAANRNPTGLLLEQSSTTTAVTMQYQTVGTGVALAFAASDMVQMTCAAF